MGAYSDRPVIRPVELYQAQSLCHDTLNPSLRDVLTALVEPATVGIDAARRRRGR
jgi:hypothetical protein